MRPHGRSLELTLTAEFSAMMAPCSTAAAAALLRQINIAHRSPTPPLESLSPDFLSALQKAEEAASASIADLDGGAADFGSMYERAATDGELLDEGVESLLNIMRPSQDAVFADLGSGNGSTLLRIAAAGEWRHCFGIELFEHKHRAAVHVLRALQDTPSLRTPITLMRGDMLELGALASAGEADAGEAASTSSTDNEEVVTTTVDGRADATTARLGDVTHAYACSVCFDDLLLRGIARSLAQRTLFPRFQALVSIRTLPSQPHLTRVGSVPLQCTWNSNSWGHVYVPSDTLARDAADRDAALLARCLCDRGVCTLPAALQPRVGFVRLPR